jgi:DNA-binding transcriptional regulator YdaS (Cro superfamily)
MITDEAAEAAAKRIAGHYGAGASNWEWYITEAREILEAATPPKPDMTLAEALRTGLKLAGVSQAWLAQRAGLSAKHVNQLLMGKVPLSVNVALRIERAIVTVSAEELMVAQAREQVRAAKAS